MSDDTDIEFVTITNAKQVGPPKKPRRKDVILKDVQSGGKATKWWCYELDALEFAEWREALEQDNADLRFLQRTLRDPSSHQPVFQDFDSIRRTLGKHGRSKLNPLVVASNEMNFSDPTDAEKNSEETQSDGSPSS